VYEGNRTIVLREFADPEPGPGEVVIAVRASGLCGSDLNYYRGPAPAPGASPRIAGHEPAGVVHAVGPGVLPGIASVGDRVMVHHYTGCGQCSMCRSGWRQMCSTRTTSVYGSDLHGAHAPYMKVLAATLVPLDDALSFEAGAAIACGTGTAWGGLVRLGDVGGADLVINGQGPVGLSATMLATAEGARVIAVDPEPNRRAAARRFGAVEAINPLEDDAPAVVRELTGRGASLALETSGNSVAATNALNSLEPWGRACFVGVGAEVRLDVLEFLRRQLTVLTSWSMSIYGQRDCADFIVKNNLPIDDLFTDRWALRDVVDAYEMFDRQAAGKGAIVFH
jgi:threonine dehydrogenase-like Zn-dependent dehydrogenase